MATHTAPVAAEVSTSGFHGYVAEFDSPESLVEAIRRAHAAGYKHLDAYSPYPVEEVIDELHLHKTGVPVIVLCAGLTGAIGGFLFQTWVNLSAYPMNIGGRPDFSWPAFVPATFEMMVLFASFGAVIGMLALNGLPRPYHPLFNVKAFARATQDRFFLWVMSTDPKFEREGTREFLSKLTTFEVSAVED